VEKEPPISERTSAAGPAAGPSTHRHLAYAAAGLVLIVLAAYAPSLSGEFVHLDDYQYVVDNQLVLQPGWTSVKRFFTEVTTPSTVDGYYQPLTMISLMVDTYLAGGRALDGSSVAMGAGPRAVDPFMYHLTNVLLHAATCVLLVLMLRSIVGGLAVPLLAVLLFAVHPAQVESVAWISQRKTVLSSLLAVGCLACYLQYGMRRTRLQAVPRVGTSGSRPPPSSEASGISPSRTWPWWWLAASVLLYVAGCLAKPTVVLLPLMLPLLDFWPLRRRPLSALAEKLPFIVFMLAAAPAAWVSQASSTAQLLAPNLSLPGVLAQLFGLMCHNLMAYLGNIFWPMSLSPYRPVPVDLSPGNPAILLSVLGSVVFAAVCLGAYRRSKPLLVGGVAFVVLLAPTLGAVRFAETCVADRFLYLPTIFLLLPLVAMISHIGRLLPRRALLIQACIGLFAVPLVILTRAQQGIWHDSHALWAHVVRSAPNLAKGHAQLAKQQLESGAFEQALTNARRALEIEPENAGYLHVLGRALVRTGQAEAAVAAIQQAIAKGLGPIEPLARVSLAEALLISGDADGARAECEQAIALGRGDLSTYKMMGEAAFRFGKMYAEAAEYFRRALERDPDDTTIRWNLGAALEYCGRDAEALAQYEQVIETCTRQGIRVPEHLEEAMRKVRQRLDQATTSPDQR
jgi:Flp pilus assembly protein TadD